MRTTSRLKRLVLAGAILAGAATFQVVDPPEASAAVYGTVKACQDIHLQGTCQTFTDNVRDLTGLAVGNDKVSSVHVEGGTRVVLWEHADFTGQCHVIDTMDGRPISDLSLLGSVVGNDQVSSISFGYSGCSGDLRPYAYVWGTSPVGEPLHTDVADLTGTAVGNDAALEVEAIRGPVAVYSDTNFEGTCVTIDTGFRGDLTTSYVGTRASSIAMGHRCEYDIQLCEDADFEGRCVSFRSNEPRLSATDLGNDTASSIRVPDDWKVVLYEHDDYKGLVASAPSFYDDGDIMWNFPVDVLGHDTVSSLKIEAPSRCSFTIYFRCR